MQKQLKNNPGEIDLLALLFALKKKLWLIISAFIVGAAAMALYTVFLVTPMYSTSSMLYLLVNRNEIISAADLQFGAQLTDDYVILIKSRAILEEVIENLGLDMSYDQLKNSISFENPSNSRVLYIKVTHPVPQTAQNLANEIAHVSCKRMAEIMHTEEPSVAEEAVLPTSPISPDIKRNCAKGGLVCAALVIAVLTLLFLLDDTIKTPDDIEKYLGISTLAVIPVKRGGKKGNHHKKQEGQGDAK